MGKLVAILLLFISISLDAQTVIVGKVIAHSGKPVNRVHIYCIESEKGTTTDSLGLFRLECPIPCTLEFSHINYKKETYKLNKSDAPFVITLRNKQNNLKEVVVTALPASGRILSSIKGIERIPAILGEQDVLKYLGHHTRHRDHECAQFRHLRPWRKQQRERFSHQQHAHRLPGPPHGNTVHVRPVHTEQFHPL